MKNVAIITAILAAFLCLPALQAGDWSFSIQSAAKAGNLDLKPGSYKLSLRGSVAVITDQKTEKSYTVVVKTAESNEKFDSTMVETAKRDGELKVISLSGGGSKTKVLFE